MIYSIIISILVGALTIVCVTIGIICILQGLRNPTPRMDNGGPRFSEVEKVKTQTVFSELVK